MAPFLPVLNMNRSQSIRLGRGPGNAVPPLNLGNVQTPTSVKLRCVHYADMGQPEVRRDYQRHSAIGAVDSAGNLTQYPWSDLYAASSVNVSSSGTLKLTTPSVILRSRAFFPAGGGEQLSVTGTTDQFTLGAGGLQGPPAAGTRVDCVWVDSNGKYGVSQGTPVTVNDVWTITGSSVSGTWDMAFEYGGYTYVTAGTISATATAAALLTGFLTAAITTGSNPKRLLPVKTGDFTTSGGAIGTAPVVLTSTVGNISNLRLAPGSSAVTGLTFTHTTVGVGGGISFPGNALPLALVAVPAGASTLTRISTGADNVVLVS